MPETQPDNKKINLQLLKLEQAKKELEEFKYWQQQELEKFLHQKAVIEEDVIKRDELTK